MVRLVGEGVGGLVVDFDPRLDVAESVVGLKLLDVGVEVTVKIMAVIYYVVIQ